MSNVTRATYPNNDKEHYAIDMQAYRLEGTDDKSYTACNWDDPRACNFEVSVYRVACGKEMEETNIDHYDDSWDSRETCSHFESHDQDLANDVSAMFDVLYPDAHAIDNDGIYE